MLERLNKALNDWYEKQSPVGRFFANIGLMCTFLSLILCGAGLYIAAIGYAIYLASNVSAWFIFLVLIAITVPIGVWFAIDMAKEEN